MSQDFKQELQWLDIDTLTHVVNYAAPRDVSDYTHRIGRTGRAGETGLALSLASMDEMGSVGKIEQYLQQESVWHPRDALTPTGSGPLLPPMVTLQLLGGRKEKIRPGDVLGALTGPEGGPALTREQVGKIAVTEFCTFVAVARSIGAAACAKLNAGNATAMTNLRDVPMFDGAAMTDVGFGKRSMRLTRLGRSEATRWGKLKLSACQDE